MGPPLQVSRRRRSALAMTETELKRHGRAGPDRADERAGERIEHAGGDRHADGVVDERQEQVLADVPHASRG